MKHKLLLRTFLLFFFLSLIGLNAQTTTVYVDDDFNSGTTGWGTTHFAKIQDGIDACSGGETIQVAAGTYTEDILINKPLTLNGANANIPYGIGRVSESILQPFTSGIAPISLGAGQDHVTINGFEITGEMSENAIYCGVIGPSYLDIKFNYIHHIGTLRSTQNIYAINYRGGPNNSDDRTDVNVSDNYFDEILNHSVSTNNKGSSAAIWFGQSNGEGTVSNVTIERNVIKNVRSNLDTKSFEPVPYDDVHKITASGIYIGIGWKDIGNVSGAIIRDNSITNIIGGSAYGIQLSGNTPGLNIQNNMFDNVSSPESPSYSYDVGISSTNTGSATIIVNNNSFSTVSYGVANSSDNMIDATENWWGNATGPSGEGPGTGVAVSTNVDYSPWLGDAEGTFYGNDDGTFSLANPSDPASVNNVVQKLPEGATLIIPAGTYNSFEVDTDGITLIGEDGVLINSGSPAIEVSASNVTITGFTFNFGNDNWAILFNSSSNNNTVYDCKFLTNYGINNASGNTDVNAENNYWGSENGPTHSTNSIGTGSVISDRVDYSPYWTNNSFTEWNCSITPANGLTGVSVVPSFQWEDLSFESDYKIELATDENFTNVIYDISSLGQNATTHSASALASQIPLNNSRTYYWRLIASTTSGTVNSKTWQFTTVPQVNVSLGHPTGGTVYTTSTMFSWSIGQATGNMKFKPQIVVSDDSPTELEWANATLTTTTSNTYHTFTLNGGTQYYWRVVVLNSNDEVISYSSEVSFTTSGGASVTVTPSWPVGGAEVYTNSPTLYWYLDQYAPGVEFKVFYVSENENANGATTNDKLDNASFTSLTNNLYIKLSDLDPGTKYYWQVQTEYDGTTGDYTAPESFVTNGSGTLIEPIPSYPTGGVEIYTVSPTLYWYLGGSTDGLTFNIEYRPQSNPGNVTTETSPSLYKQITNLTPGLTYEWKVQSDNGSDESDWSDWETFKISGGVTSSKPVASFPIGNPTIYTDNPTLSWYLDGSSLGIEGYNVKYSTSDLTGSWDGSLGSPDADDGEFTINSLNTTSWKVTADLTYGQKYYWAVAAKDASGNLSDFSTTESFTLAGGPSAGNVVLSNPIGGVVINTNSPTLRWYFTGSTLGLVGYDVEYSDNGGLSSWTEVTSALSSTNTYTDLTNLTAGATYSWRVRAYYGGSTYGSWSTVETFTVDNGSNIVQPLVGGPNNVTINSSSATLSWINPAQSSEQLSYEVQISETADFADYEVVESGYNYSSVNNLQEGSEYYWRVRAKSSDGEYSNFSSPGKFDTDDNITSVSDEDSIPVEFSLDQNYPNPFNPSTTIRYSIPKASFVTIRIYNMLGQEVKSLVNKEVPQGRFDVTWNGDNNYGQKISSGTYIYQISAGEFMQARKMILLK